MGKVIRGMRGSVLGYWVPRSLRCRVSASRALRVGFADCSLALATLDPEPLAAPWRGESVGGGGKDAPPTLRAALRVGQGSRLAIGLGAPVVQGVAHGVLLRADPLGRDELR